MRSEKSICATARLSEFSPTSPLKRYQCSSDHDGLLVSSFCGRSSSASSFHGCAVAWGCVGGEQTEYKLSLFSCLTISHT